MPELIPVSTHTMLTSFGRCPRMAMYAYVDKIRPKTPSRPLKMGGWVHSLLEAHYKGENWKDKHEELLVEHESKFFEEELKDVPDSAYRIMRSYLWHYQLESKYGWKVLEVELELEFTWPDGTTHKVKLDLLVEINGEIVIVDHKLRTQFPSHLQRLLDSQNLLYIYAAAKNKIKVSKFIWNYLRMKPPTIPQILKNGTLSKRKIETDYITLRDVIEHNKIDKKEHTNELRALRAQYWRPGKDMSDHPFFRRIEWDKDIDTVKRLVKEMHRTHKDMRGYDFSDRDSVRRVRDNSCDYRCSYPLICSTEMFGGNVEQVLRNYYDVVDPLDYYNSDSSGVV